MKKKYQLILVGVIDAVRTQNVSKFRLKSFFLKFWLTATLEYSTLEVHDFGLAAQMDILANCNLFWRLNYKLL